MTKKTNRNNKPATVDDEPTEETTYICKTNNHSRERINNRKWFGICIEGEKITYTITVKNDGGLADDVQIQDTFQKEQAL